MQDTRAISTTLRERLSTPIPKLMRVRPLDARGYPIPFVVLIDRSGVPQFTINDEGRSRACITRKLCAICGRRLDAGAMWFVGGSRCFMLPNGAFVDPPLHYDCAAYALRVCPFLAAPSYAKRIDDKKLAPGDVPEGYALGRVAYMNPMQPERFGLGCTDHYDPIDAGTQGRLLRVTRWTYVEWWRNGEQVNAPDAPPPDQSWKHF